MGNRNPASALTPPPCGVRTVGLSGNDMKFFFFFLISTSFHRIRVGSAGRSRMEKKEGQKQE